MDEGRDSFVLLKTPVLENNASVTDLGKHSSPVKILDSYHWTEVMSDPPDKHLCP